MAKDCAAQLLDAMEDSSFMVRAYAAQNLGIVLRSAPNMATVGLSHLMEVHKDPDCNARKMAATSIG